MMQVGHVLYYCCCQYRLSFQSSNFQLSNSYGLFFQLLAIVPDHRQSLSLCLNSSASFQIFDPTSIGKEFAAAL